jgi:hypothetical protein
MADLLTWLITHSVAVFVGVCIGAGGLGGGILVVRKMTKGKFFGPVPTDENKPK